MIHQHRFGHAIVEEGMLQPFLHGFGARASGFLQRDDKAAVIVDHRQWSHRLLAALRTFEVHLPELVGSVAFEALPGDQATIVRTHQSLPQQDAVHGDHRYEDTFAAEQMLQFAGSPVGPRAPQVDDALFDWRRGLLRRTPGTAAVLLDPRHSVFAVALQPNIAGGPRDAELGTQPAEIFLSLLSPYDKLHPLIAYRHRSPRHSRPLPADALHCRTRSARAAV